ncbi:MAG: hypothetical protein BZ138_06430 [Methanosphaera sp. rholeuAM270]|nr:MAG: hypothetical protein BZ138_06430 [Methanosphaera sp. rholeuAM270]
MKITSEELRCCEPPSNMRMRDLPYARRFVFSPADIDVYRQVLESLRTTTLGLVRRAASLELTSYVTWLLQLSSPYASLLSFNIVSLDRNSLDACLVACYPELSANGLSQHPGQNAWTGPDYHHHGPISPRARQLLDDVGAYSSVAMVWKSLVGTGRFLPDGNSPSLSDKTLVEKVEAELGVSEMVKAVISGVPPADAFGGCRFAAG